MRLLLVEDDNHVAAALSAVLARHGFDVTHARSGEEALQALVPESDGFGVVLLDLGLPDQDGYEVCGKIRKRTSTPVIMVTARSDVRSRIHGLNLGADDYVVKPYDTGELLARIHAVSPAQRPRRRRRLRGHRAAARAGPHRTAHPPGQRRRFGGPTDPQGVRPARAARPAARGGLPPGADHQRGVAHQLGGPGAPWRCM